MVIFTFAGFLLGIILGSFTKALADRSLSNKSFLGRSQCYNCKKILQWYDLIPLFSYIFLKGHCRYCHQAIGYEYPLVELVTGALIGFLFGQSFIGISTLNQPTALAIVVVDLVLKSFFITILVAIVLTDIKKTLIPDRIIIPSILIGILGLVILTLVKIGHLYYGLTLTPLGRILLTSENGYFLRHLTYTIEDFMSVLLTAFGLGLFFLILIIVTKGKGMGGGDVKLGFFMGLGLGYPNGILATFLAFLMGAVYSVVLVMLKRASIKQSIAFGPFLVTGSLIALFFGSQIIGWYLKLN